MSDAEENLRKFFQKYSHERISKRGSIIDPHEDFEYLYFVEEGVVRSYYLNNNGNEFTVNFLKPGSVFPLSIYLSGKSNIYGFDSYTDVLVRKAPKVVVGEFINENKETASYFLKKFAEGLEGYLIRSQFLIKGTAMQKVASSFIFLSKRFGIGSGKNIKIELPFTHQDISNLCGITRETTTICINDLEKQNIITRKRKYIEIIDIDRLNKIVSVFEDGSKIDFEW